MYDDVIPVSSNCNYIYQSKVIFKNIKTKISVVSSNGIDIYE